MDTRMLSAARGVVALWAIRCAGMGVGLLAVLGAVLLGWLAWPALLGGWLGGCALLALLALRGRRDIAWRGAHPQPLPARANAAPAIRREAA